LLDNLSNGYYYKRPFLICQVFFFFFYKIIWNLYRKIIKNNAPHTAERCINIM